MAQRKDLKTQEDHLSKYYLPGRKRAWIGDDEVKQSAEEDLEAANRADEAGDHYAAKQLRHLGHRILDLFK